ncbi:MAG: Na/Pi cotransporter family protein [Clostridia bacterium]|nr:Na/Pi cotransporter family protein [Clostridia bacterium]
MDIFSIFSLFGGLALFLYGMHIMSDGLEKMAGSKLKTILETLTSSKLKGLALGLLVTAIIQSSSATTVMVVGFVNSGLMELSRSIPIIMGANIGTTVTGWLISLTGITGDTWWLKMLKPSSFSPIVAAIGVVMIMMGKKAKHKDIGGIMIGFAVLMYGMEAMSGAVEPLSNDPNFANLFTLFSNPFLGVLVGAGVTAVIQSSSASVGILQALSVTGAITYSAAIPIIMGQGIGTCVTAVLSAMGTNTDAKRAAAVHLIFNIVGTIVCLTAFYICNAIFGFAFMDTPIDVFGIAVVNTAFKVVSTVILMPFSKQLEQLARFFVKDSKAENQKNKQFQSLDVRFLQTPAFAIEQCRKLTVDMAHKARLALEQAMDMVVSGYNEDVANQIIAAEDELDIYEDKLGSYLVLLSRESLSVNDSHEISMLLHAIGDFERIGDHAVNLLRSATEIHDKKITFSPTAQRGVGVMSSAVREITNITMQSFEEENVELAMQVEPLEQVVDYLKVELKKSHIDRLQKGECTIELGFVLNDLINNYERVADHCSNIAVALIEITRDKMETHEFLAELKGSNDPEFVRSYKNYMHKYRLD